MHSRDGFCGRFHRPSQSSARNPVGRTGYSVPSTRLSYHRWVNIPARIVVFVICLVLAVSAAAQEGESEEPQTYKEKYEQQQKKIKKPIEYPWFVGGAVGFAFGSETSYAEFSPVFGYRISQKFQLGGSLTFRYRKDKRFEPDLSTTDFGGSIVGRYFVFDPIFLQAEVERLNWEYVARTDDGYTTVDSTYTGLYAGLGFVQQAGPRSAMYMSFLWDFAFDSDEPSPNTHPWLIRIGFGFKF